MPTTSWALGQRLDRLANRVEYSITLAREANETAAAATSGLLASLRARLTHPETDEEFLERLGELGLEDAIAGMVRVADVFAKTVEQMQDNVARLDELNGDLGWELRRLETEPERAERLCEAHPEMAFEGTCAACGQSLTGSASW